MQTLRCLLQLVLLTFFSGLLDGSQADAEAYPSGPVKFITPIAAGSGTDAGDADHG